MQANKQSSISTQNIGVGDRLIRYIVGATLIGMFMTYEADANRYDELLANLVLLSIVIISTAIIKWDPIYAMLGINTGAGVTRKPRNAAVNVGMTDSAMRLATGSVMIGGFMLFSPTPVGWTVILPLLAIPVIVTAIIGWCPIYALAKVKTTGRLSRALKVQQSLSRPTAPKTPRIRAGQPKAA